MGIVRQWVVEPLLLAEQLSGNQLSRFTLGSFRYALSVWYEMWLQIHPYISTLVTVGTLKKLTLYAHRFYVYTGNFQIEIKCIFNWKANTGYFFFFLKEILLHLFVLSNAYKIFLMSLWIFKAGIDNHNYC